MATLWASLRPPFCLSSGTGGAILSAYIWAKELAADKSLSRYGFSVGISKMAEVPFSCAVTPIMKAEETVAASGEHMPKLVDELLVGADSDGALWTRPTPKDENTVTLNEEGRADDWQWRKIHSAEITALHILGDRIITASYDRDVKIWQKDTMKLLGQFRCQAPVSSLQPCLCSDTSLLLMVGDTLGNVYFLKWGCA